MPQDIDVVPLADDPFHLERLKAVLTQLTSLIDTWKKCETSASGVLTKLKGLPLADREFAPLDELKERLRDAVTVALALSGTMAAFATLPSSEAEALNALQNIAGRDWKSLDAALASVSEIKDAISRIHREHRDCELRIAAQWEKIMTLAQDLERSFPKKIAATSLQQALREERRLGELIGEMTTESNSALTESKAQGEADLETLAQEFDFGALASTWNDNLNELRLQLASAGRIPEVKAALVAIADFRERLTVTPEAQRLTVLAEATFSSDLKASSVLSVIQALNRRKRFGEALGLLTILQSSFDVEEADLADFSPLVDALLEAATGVCDLKTNHLWWPEVVLSQPWITSLAASDVKDVVVQRKLTVCLMLLAQHRPMEEWKPYFFRFDQWVLFEHTGTPIIQSVVSEMTDGPPSRIAEVRHQTRLAGVDAEIDDFFRFDTQHAEFVQQVAKKQEVNQVERDVLFPKLQKLVQEVKHLCAQREFDQARRRVGSIDGQELWAESCKSRRIDPWKGNSYTKGICGVHGYIPRLKEMLKKRVAAASESPHERIISAEELCEDFRKLAAQESPCGFWNRAIVDVTDAPPVREETSPFGTVLAKLSAAEPAVTVCASLFVISLCENPLQHQENQLSREWNRSLLADSLRLLPESRHERKHVEKLRNANCLYHVAKVAALIEEMQPEVEDLVRQSDEKLDELRRILAKRKDQPFEGNPVEEVSIWLDWACIPAVEAWVARQVEQDRQAEAITEDEKRRKLDALVTGLAGRRAAMMSSDTEDVLQEGVLEVMNAIDMRALRLRRLGPEQRSFDAALKQLEEWTDTIRFITEHQNHQALAELRAELLPNLVPPIISVSDGADSQSEGDLSALSPQDQGWISDALGDWRILAEEWDLDELENVRLLESSRSTLSQGDQAKLVAIFGLKELIKRFLTPFCGRCRLYATERSDLNEGKNLAHHNLGSTILTVGVTTMRLPRNRHLFKKFSLIVLPGKHPTARHIDAASNWIEEHPDDFSIVLVPGRGGSLDRLKHDLQSAKTLVVGPDDLEPLLSGPTPNSARDRLRQAFVREAGRAAMPFRADGVVHFENDLFAGRKDELEALVTHNGFFVCGGRRTGKTSLMQALNHRISTSCSGWRVAYIDGQIFRDVQSKSVGHWDLENWRQRSPDSPRPANDPDLKIAREIASKLGVEQPVNLDDFRHTLLTLATETQVAILIDEIDCYIHASRWYHGDQRLPLMSHLRSVDFELNGRLKIIFAGFKDLYFESNRRDIIEVGQPLGNWLEYMSVGTLPYHPEAGDDLIREGLTNQMGFKVEAKACQRIWELASGHPAFIQYLCGKIATAKLAGGRGTQNIELSDVDAVYEDTKSGDGQRTFLGFVAHTLEMNLDALERSIILTIALSFREEGERGMPIARGRITEELGVFFNIDGKDVPAHDHLQWAFENLKMAGLLEEPNTNFFQFKFRSYFDILTRFNQLPEQDKQANNRSNLDVAIREYDKMRHAVKQSLL